MSDQFVGEIRWFPYTRGAPSGWLPCDGSAQQISNYQVLYQLIGVTYGGDGNTTFNLPDLRGRAPVHQGAGNGLTPRSIGQQGGTETVTLQTPEIPTHNHNLVASSVEVSSETPGGNMLGTLPGGTTMYLDDLTDANPLNPMTQMFTPTGQGTAHDNCAPSLPLLPCIACEGVYPVRQD